MGDADARDRRTANRRPRRYHSGPGDPLPSFPGHAVFDDDRVPRLQGQRRRVQGHGPRGVRQTDNGRAGRSDDSAAGRRFVFAGAGVFRVSDHRGESYSSKFVDLFGPPRDPYDPIDLDSSKGSASRIVPPACSACSRTSSWISRAVSVARRDCPICVSAAASRSTVWRMPVSLPNPASIASSFRPRRVTPAARWEPRCMPIGSISQSRSRRARSSILGTGGGRESAGRAAREDGQAVEELGDTAMIERVVDELTAGRIVGWMEGACEFGPRALGHRSILAPPHAPGMRDRLNREIKRREEFRPFAPVVPSEVADRFFDLPPGGARLGRFMSGVFPVRAEWRRAPGGGHARRWLRAGAGPRARDGAAAARAARGVRPPHRHSGAAQHVVQRRRRADRHAGRSRATRRTGAAASMCSSAGAPSSARARRHRRRRPCRSAWQHGRETASAASTAG